MKEVEADIMGAEKLSAAPRALTSTLSSFGHVCFGHFFFFANRDFIRPLSQHVGAIWI